jgi:hypothetical protein
MNRFFPWVLRRTECEGFDIADCGAANFAVCSVRNHFRVIRLRYATEWHGLSGGQQNCARERPCGVKKVTSGITLTENSAVFSALWVRVGLEYGLARECLVRGPPPRYDLRGRSRGIND